VVLDVHGEVLLPRLERHALRHRPARKGAVALETEVVVQPPGVVALDDEDRLLLLALLRAERLWRLLRVALALVLAEFLGQLGSFALRGTSALLLRALLPSLRQRLARCLRPNRLERLAQIRPGFEPRRTWQGTTYKEGWCPPKSFSTQRGGRLFGPVCRPEVVLGSGEKAVDVVERRRPSGPRICQNLGEAPNFPQARKLTQA
jgi:hypothetical protein